MIKRLAVLSVVCMLAAACGGGRDSAERPPDSPAVASISAEPVTVDTLQDGRVLTTFDSAGQIVQETSAVRASGEPIERDRSFNKWPLLALAAVIVVGGGWWWKRSKGPEGYDDG